jgi:CBS domain-containing protein
MAKTNRIENRMTEYPATAAPRTGVTAAIALMRKHAIRHLPVVSKGKVVGIVSDRDLRQAEILSDSMQLLVSDVMTRKPYCVKVGTPLMDVAAVMAKRKLGCAIVLDRENRVVGIFTTTDGMRVLSEVLKSGSQTSTGAARLEKLIKATYLI